MIVQLPIEFRLCEEGDLPTLEWMGLHTTRREIIRSAFEAQQRGEGLMLLAMAGGFPVGQAWRNQAAAALGDTGFSAASAARYRLGFDAPCRSAGRCSWSGRDRTRN